MCSDVFSDIVVWGNWMYEINVVFSFEFLNLFKFGKIPTNHLDAVRYYYVVRCTGLHSSYMRDSVFSGRWLPLLDGK